MFAPLRSVMAIQSTHCQMDDMPVMNSMVQGQSAQDQSSNHMNHDQSTAVDQQCCCCDDACAGSCDMGMSASLVMQSSSYGPVFRNVSESVSISTDILVRELTPPSRPPANLYN